MLAATGCGQGSPSGADQATIRIVITPYFEYQPWIVAHNLGLDKQQGLNLTFTNATAIQAEVAQLQRGDVELASAGIATTLPFYKQVPKLRNWLITNQFKGFIVVGRKGQTQTFKDLSAQVGPTAAKEQILKSFKGRNFALVPSAFGGLVTGTLAQVGLSLSDIKITEFPDDASAALAFERGVADYYMGSLPQETKLLLESPNKYVNVGGHELMGPAGLFYSTMFSMGPWLDGNKTTVYKLLAVWYRTMKYMKESPDKTVPLMASSINERAAANFTNDQVRFILANFEDFMTLDAAKAQAYAPSSDLYWKRSADVFSQSTSKDTLPSDYSVTTYDVEETYFNEFLKQTSLVDWVNSPLK
jgi:ABC-type nitrate/sulfonate/bicarbonate transport system substrate-binding protein